MIDINEKALNELLSMQLEQLKMIDKENDKRAHVAKVEEILKTVNMINQIDIISEKEKDRNDRMKIEIIKSVVDVGKVLVGTVTSITTLRIWYEVVKAVMQYDEHHIFPSVAFKLTPFPRIFK